MCIYDEDYDDFVDGEAENDDDDLVKQYVY